MKFQGVSVHGSAVVSCTFICASRAFPFVCSYFARVDFVLFSLPLGVMG